MVRVVNREAPYHPSIVFFLRKLIMFIYIIRMLIITVITMPANIY